MNISIFYAFPHEIRRLARLLGAVCENRSCCRTFETAYKNSRLVFVETGMGGEAAGKAFVDHVAMYSPDIIISTGFAGALSPEASIGETIFVTTSLLCGDDEIVASLELPSLPQRSLPSTWWRCGSLVTLRKWMRKTALRKVLPSALPFPVCDMETYFLAKSSVELNIPFFSLRAVSDDWLTDIPQALRKVCDSSGTYSPARAVAILSSRPFLIPEAIRLGLCGRLAARRLGHEIMRLLDILSRAQSLKG